MQEKLEHQVKVYDLVICGAGIYGAWCAYDAALRGLKVLIVDQGDIANATSSASSKLIHGGLRYLEQFNFNLVKKSAIERQLLFELAPHRVSPLRFGVPIYKKSRVKSWKFKVGLTLYDYLAKLKNADEKHSSFNTSQFLEKFPQLNESELVSGFTYMDAQTDDARFTLELIDGAVELGAELMTYTKLLEYNEEYGHVAGVTLKPKGGPSFFLKTRSALHTGGYYTDKDLSTNLCRLSKGVHLTLPSIGLTEALLLLSPEDGRVFFVIPWYGITLVGTTDTDYKGPLSEIKADEDDVEYLLRQCNSFLRKKFTRKDVIQTFAGLRVLKKSNHSHPSAACRDWLLHELENGVFVSIGGKFTSARADSVEAIDTICQRLNIHERSKTHKQHTPWAPADYESFTGRVFTEFSQTSIDRPTLNLLIQRQGKRSLDILEKVKHDPEKAKRIHPDLPFIKAEWEYVIENEFIKTYQDLFRRRFPISLLHKLSENEKASLKKEANEIFEAKFNDKLVD